MTIYYKFLDESGLSPFAHKAWRLPTNDAPGKWMPKLRGKLIPCVRGYHACQEQGLIKWIAPTLYELEYDGEVIEDRDKVLGRKARLVRKVDTWNDRTARLFAADCAEHVLHLFEQRYPDDDRPRQAIAAARAFANGEIDELIMAVAGAAAMITTRDAAGNAAWAAAGAATRAVTRAAAWNAAMAAAGAATRAVARAAAGVGAGVRAGDAERVWQNTRLLQYLRGRIS